MTKKATSKSAAKEPVQQYVVLTRISYKSMIPDEQEYIDPFVNPETGKIDPYHPDARRVTLEHMRPIDRNLLLMRNTLAKDK
ncbi:MAG: hypothetical protein DRI46_08380 [Chloroflexi bacterium]|nr:MAG: hypothetical protein DRI46_08380 [Chloroflexota bacterium]